MAWIFGTRFVPLCNVFIQNECLERFLFCLGISTLCIALFVVVKQQNVFHELHIVSYYFSIIDD